MTEEIILSPVDELRAHLEDAFAGNNITDSGALNCDVYSRCVELLNEIAKSDNEQLAYGNEY